MNAVLENNTEKVQSILLNKHMSLNKYYGKDMDTLLHLAVNNGNSAICSMLMQNGASVDVMNVNDVTPLHIAITHGDIKILNVLLLHGADIHRKNKESKSYLHVAISRGHMDISKKLLEDYHFDIENADDKGWTAIHSAAESGNWGLFQYLTENGSDVYSTAMDSKHCLHIAASKGHFQFSKKLLQNYRFNIESKDAKGWTVIHCAAGSGNLELFKYLVQHESDIYCRTKVGRSCLHIAASGGHLKLCKILLEKYKFSIYARDDNWCTVLHCACESGKLHLFQYFIEKGSKVASETKNKMSCLHFDVSEGYLKLSERLVETYNLDIKSKNTKGWNVLHCAAKSGNFHLFRYLIQKGLDVNENTKDNKNSLHIAAQNGHFTFCKLFLENYKFDIKKADGEGSSLLHSAAECGNIELIQYLIDKGCDIYRKKKNGMNSLHIAALNDRFHLCKVLLEKANFDIHLHDENGASAIYFAAHTGDLDLFQYLAQKGSNIYIKTKDGINCLHIAALKGRFHLCKVLLEKHNFNTHIKDNAGRSVLHFAAETGYLQLFQYLKEKVSDVYNKTNNGTNCLHIAASKGHFRLCKVLLEKYKFDIHKKDDSGCSVLHFAAQHGDLQLFCYFRKKGIDVYSRKKNGMNCLHSAALNGHFHLCNLLLQEHSFDIDMTDDDGRSVLHFAAENGLLELFEYFTENGSDVLSKTKNGMNCLHIAASNSCFYLCKVLLDKHCVNIHVNTDNGWSVLHCASQTGDLELFQYLKEKGGDVNGQTKNGRNCLHIAALNGRLRLCKMLLENYNFDLHMDDDDGWSVLHCATKSGDLELFQYLTERGGSVNSVTKKGSNCLHIAAINSHLRLCKMLLENYNFDLHIKDDNGWSLLHCAAKTGDIELFQYLTEKGSNIYQQNRDGMNCLHIAVVNGCFRLCKVLLKTCNFDLHTNDDDERLVIHFAAEAGHLELFRYLIDKGSDIYREKRDGMNCLHIAALNGHLRLCIMLLENYNFHLEMTNDDGWSALLYAAQAGNLELFQYLIGKGSNVYKRKTDGMTCFHIAASNGRLRLCKMLLDNYNFDIEMINDDGWSALLCAACTGHLELFKYLIEKGSNIYREKRDGMNCLHIAAANGHLRLCKVLLENYKFDLKMINDDGWSALLYAAEAGHLELFQYLTGKGSNVYRRKRDGMTCLHIAVWNGHLRLCKMLLENYNFDLEMIDDDGWSALLCAACTGHLELFKYLIEKGSNIYREKRDGMNCLHIAAANGHLRLCKVLLENYKFDLKMINDDGWSALLYAAEAGHLELFQYLTGKGSNVYRRKRDGMTCLHIAARNGCLRLCKMLLDNYNFDLEMMDDDGWSALLCAACTGHLELFKYLIEKGSNIYREKRDGMNCLHIAAANGHLRLCKVLLENYKFDLQMINDDGWSALLYAAEAGHLELFQYLTGKGSNVYRRKRDGMTCLHIAASNGRLRLCKMLLDNYNFDLEMMDDDGWSALLCAACTGHLELFKYLIEKGSNIYREKRDGMNCLHIAALNGHLRLCKLLLENYNFDLEMIDEDGWCALLCAACTGHLELFKYLIEKDNDIYRRKRDGMNFLHIAAANGHLCLCKVLLETYKLDLQMTDDNGWSVLHLAAKAGNVELFQYLIDKGSDVYRQNGDGMNCLHIAAMNGHLRLCKKLLEICNVDLQMIDDHGWSVLHFVSEDGNLELFQYLIHKVNDVYRPNGDGMNCFHIAAANGHLRLCKVLLETYKLDLQMTDDNGWSVLHLAAKAGNVELFQYLIDKGSDVYRRKRDGMNCLHIAAVNGRFRLCKVLLETYKLDLQMTDDNGWSVLHLAAKAGNVELFQYLIDKGSDVYRPKRDGMNCLHIAAVNGRFRLCKVLLETYKLDVQMSDDDGWSVLHFSAKAGNIELFQYLIDEGSDVYRQKGDGMNSLHIAALNGHLRLCKVLLEFYNVDLQMIDDNGWSVLHSAAKGGNLELFQYLIDKGSDVYRKKRDGMNCLHIVAEDGHLRLCKVLLEIYSVDLQIIDDNGWSVLHSAAKDGNLELFQYLIDKGSDVYRRKRDGMNCLHIAAVNGRFRLCKVLLETYKPNLQVSDDDGWSVLHFAAKAGNIELFQYLIDKGSDVYRQKGDGMNCLHIAAVNGHLRLCKMLLETYKLDLQMTDDNGRSVLHSVSEDGNLELFQYLIEKGSDVYTRKRDGMNCLDIAAANGCLRLCKILLETYKLDLPMIDDNGCSVLQFAARAGNLELVQYLIEKGSDVYRQKRDGMNCLHIAAEDGHLRLCKVLLEIYNVDLQMSDDDAWSVLHFAAKAGNIELFQYLIDKGSDVYRQKGDGMNCLHIAALNGHLRLCKVLLEFYNVDLQMIDDNGWSVLHSAAKAGNIELFQYLIDKGSDVYRQNGDGMNCLHIAAVNGHLRLCKMLLETYKLDLQMTDDNGRSVLHSVSEDGNLELFQYLIEKGSDVYRRKRDGMNCLDIAAANGCLRLCKMLLETYKLDLLMIDDNGCSVLHFAARAGNLELVQYLIEKGSDVYRQKRDGMNCLHIAAEDGHLRLCKVLLEIYNVDLQMSDDDGWSVLHFAAKAGNIELFQYLIDKGSDVYRQKGDGMNCLHIAALNGHLRLCKVLLEFYNVDLQMINDNGWSVLHSAAKYGNIELFQYLIDKGSDVYRRKRDGMNCLHIAAVNGRFRLCKVLLETYKPNLQMSDDDGWSVLHFAAKAGNIELFQYLIDKGSDVYRQKGDGMNCLHIAAVNGHLRLCKMLLETYKLDLQMTDDNGRSVLHSVSEDGNLELFQYLIEKGSDVYRRKRDGMNCLDIAAANGCLRLCKMLLDTYKLDLPMIDDNGCSVLHFAARAGNLELVQYLIEKGSDVYRQKRDGMNCLHIAAEDGHLRLCKVLLEIYNVDLQMSDDDGWSVLHFAAKAGNIELFQYLIDKGSDVYRQKGDGMNCLHIAALNGHLRLCKVLLEIYNVDIQMIDDNGLSVLHSAAKGGNVELFQYLIDKGSDVYRQKRDGMNCLHIVAEDGHLRLCKVLLEIYSVDLQMIDDNGWSVLHSAAKDGNIELFQYLIDKGSDVYRRKRDGMNCLHIAAVNGRFRLCKVLLEIYNFDLQMVDDSGWSVLHFAGMAENLELFEYLIGKGSNVYRRDSDGINCLHIAAGNGHLRLCKVLLEIYKLDLQMIGGVEWPVLHFAATTGNLELFQYLIDKGSDVDRRNSDGVNCLHIAAGNCHLHLCKILLEFYKLDLHLIDYNGWSVLHFAAKAGDLVLFQYLIGKGSDVYRRNRDGMNCLHIAAEDGHLRLCKVLLENYKLNLELIDDYGCSVLLCAAKSGNLALVQYLIEKGGNVDIQDRNGMNILHIAANNGHLRLCKVLLENCNFDILIKSDDGWSALHCAAKAGHLELFHYLIEMGCNVYRGKRDGMNCLHIAASNGCFRLCKVLLDKYKFDLHVNSNSGLSVLHCAVEAGHLELFQYLIERGSIVHRKTKDGMNCLHIAATNSCVRFCKVLLKNYNFDIHMDNNNGWSLVHFAAKNGDLELFQYLIIQGSNVYSRTKDGMNCLHIAGLNGCFRLCKMLLEKYNVDINLRDDNEGNVLHFAAESGIIELCQYIIEKGSDIFSKKKDGKNSLHIAALNGHFHLCKVLLENYQFDIHMTDNNGMNVLLFAAESGNLDLCHYLIEKGSNINSVAINNMNCLLTGASQGRFRLCKALLENFDFEVHMQNNKGFNALHYAAENGDLEMFNYFLHRGSYVDSKTKDNRDCLHIAASRGYSSLCKKLLELYGFKVNMKCDKGWAAIHYATESGDLDLIKYFVKKGSDIYWKTKNNTNCLHIAASKGHINLCKILLEKYNFDIFFENGNGWNVLHFAVRSGDLEIFQLFIQNGIDISSKTKLNSNCLHIAAANGHFSLCKALVEVYNFDIFSKNDKGWSVLNNTAKSGNLELFQYFTLLGADVYSKTNNNFTCCHIASYFGHLNICRNIFDLYQLDLKRKANDGVLNLNKWNAIYKRTLFRDKKCFLNLKDLYGNTYLHYASYGGHTNICKLLLTYGVDVTYRNGNGKTARDIAIKNKFQNVLAVLKETYDPLGK